MDIFTLLDSVTFFSPWYQMRLGLGSPASLHWKMILVPSSDCLITGRSVKVGFTPPVGMAASSLSKLRLIVALDSPRSFLAVTLYFPASSTVTSRIIREQSNVYWFSCLVTTCNTTNRM